MSVCFYLIIVVWHFQALFGFLIFNGISFISWIWFNMYDVVIWNCRHSIVLMYFWVNDINIFSLGDLWNTFNKTLFDRFNVLLNLNNLPEKKFLEVGFVYLRIFYFRYLILYHIADLQCNLTIQDVSDKNKLLGHKHSNIFDHVFSNRVSM